MIRRADEAEVPVLAENSRRMWLEIGWRPETLREDWLERVTLFIERARAEAEFAAFVAEVEGAIAGSAACQLFAGLYPEIRRASSHRAGYVWGVYTRPDYRRRGIATKLTRAALDHLLAVGCTRATLHASAAGAPVYRAMGFRATHELGLTLADAAQTGQR